MSSSVDFIKALQDANMAGMAENRSNAVLVCRAQAISYVWGRQDAGESEHDTQVSIAFADAYGLHALEYETGRSGHRRMLRDAYARWVETGGID